MEKEFCDFKIFVGKQVIHAHKIVLMQGCDYFRAMLSHPVSCYCSVAITRSEICSQVTHQIPEEQAENGSGNNAKLLIGSNLITSPLVYFLASGTYLYSKSISSYPNRDLIYPLITSECARTLYGQRFEVNA